MSYTIVPKQTPHVPELDWGNAVTVTVAPADVPTSGGVVVHKAPQSFSGVVSAIVPGGWSGSSHISVSENEFGGTADGTPTIEAETPSGGGGNSAVFSKGNWVRVSVTRTSTSTTNAYIFFVPWKGQF